MPLIVYDVAESGPDYLLQIAYFVEFDFVDDRREGRYVLCSLFSEGHLAGEIESVGASGTHHTEGFEETGHQCLTDDVGDGFAVAVGLVKYLPVGEGALVVEDDDESVGSLTSVAFFQHFIVESLVTLLDIGIILH